MLLNNEVEDHVSCSIENSSDKWVSNEVEAIACFKENNSDSLLAYKNSTTLYCNEIIENYNEGCNSNEDQHTSCSNGRLVSTDNDTSLQCHESIENDNECYHSNEDENMTSSDDTFVSSRNYTSLQCNETMENDNECCHSYEDENISCSNVENSDRLVTSRNDTTLQCDETMENDNECCDSSEDKNDFFCMGDYTKKKKVVSSLPRLFDDSFTVPVKLKRRLAYKHYYRFEVERPKKVLDAARYLVNKSELFKNEGIEVSDSWIDTVESNNSAEWSEFFEREVLSNVSCEGNNENASKSNDSSHSNRNGTAYISENDDQWREVDERPSGVTDTLLQDPDPIQDVDKIINVAPAEGARPLGLFIDKDLEFLAFPTIFCGERRCENKDRVIPVHYSTICKWELRNKDRRVAKSVSNIFYKLKKLQIKRIQDTASLSLRKCKTKGRKLTAGDLKSPQQVNNLIQLDEGFRVLKDMRGSPAYFERCKKDLFAMIWQLGNPTWFCSFSAAETRWHHLLKMLGRLIDNIEYSDDDINEMNWEKKSKLIQKDPVSCARNFDYMVQRLIYDVLKSDVMPVGEIADFFYRVEFQQRRSPHIHALLWIKNAPHFELRSNNEIIEFVDKYLTCENNTSVEMVDLVNLQTHRHAKTCKQKGQKICRFNFPLPPMRTTIILSPLNKENLTDDELRDVKDQSDKIKESLDDMKYGLDISFDEFLNKLSLTEEQYIRAVRYVIFS
ncbi:hypothetical protein ACROYT_G011384 [Oculina patagonica]